MTLLARLGSWRTWRIIAIVYVVKAALVGGAWLLVPDLPERTAQTLRQALSSPAAPAVEEQR